MFIYFLLNFLFNVKEIFHIFLFCCFKLRGSNKCDLLFCRYYVMHQKNLMFYVIMLQPFFTVLVSYSPSLFPLINNMANTSLLFSFCAITLDKTARIIISNKSVQAIYQFTSFRRD